MIDLEKIEQANRMLNDMGAEITGDEIVHIEGITDKPTKLKDLTCKQRDEFLKLLDGDNSSK